MSGLPKCTKDRLKTNSYVAYETTPRLPFSRTSGSLHGMSHRGCAQVIACMLESCGKNKPSGNGEIIGASEEALKELGERRLEHVEPLIICVTGGSPGRHRPLLLWA